MKMIAAAAAALALSLPISASASERVAALKAEIVAVAKANQARQDNLDQVRSELQTLVDELVALVPPRTEAEKKAQVVGAWHNLWADMPFGPFVDYAQVYQVVYGEGHYYNISREVLPSGASVTGYLRGTFADEGDWYRIEFTRNVVSREWLGSGADLVDAGAAVESGYTAVTDVPGPVGVRGQLRNVFVDDEVRIVTGLSDGEPADSLFVLERVDVTL